MTTYYIAPDNSVHVLDDEAYVHFIPPGSRKVSKAEADLQNLARQPKVSAAEIRSRRDALLARSDWTQMKDVSMAAQRAAEWSAYRQALRDLTAQPGFPDNIQWPEAP